MKNDENLAEKVYENEEIINNLEECITNYLVKLSKCELSDKEKNIVEINGNEYEIKGELFPTVTKENPYELSIGEEDVVNELKFSFLNSNRLKEHVEFLYSKGAIYVCCNNNPLFHGCIPLDKDGTSR